MVAAVPSGYFVQLGQAWKEVSKALLHDPAPRALERLGQQLTYYCDGQQLTDSGFLPTVFGKPCLMKLEPVVDVNVQK